MVNIEGACPVVSDSPAVGLIVRDHHGLVETYIRLPLVHPCLEAALVEAAALAKGIANVIHNLLQAPVDHSSLKEARELFRQHPLIAVHHIRRSTNMAANGLAQFALSISRPIYYAFDSPSNVLVTDAVYG
ncbi:hypothetical protein F3Y22_tig00110954pilonHSYRG00067 [Hibiscus syriacus]|uniref:RNase H type-1 domain-containing protein n=1 Tax=Hibiscus syriacus TaxID=106335 RepID=A0A6A2ZA68_HIBSY|nr:hypothetical protein F3Y22_tig00110954pilonHSYRG00067 [Hibiscus syriacus]